MSTISGSFGHAFGTFQQILSMAHKWTWAKDQSPQSVWMQPLGFGGQESSVIWAWAMSFQLTWEKAGCTLFPSTDVATKIFGIGANELWRPLVTNRRILYIQNKFNYIPVKQQAIVNLNLFDVAVSFSQLPKTSALFLKHIQASLLWKSLRINLPEDIFSTPSFRLGRHIFHAMFWYFPIFWLNARSRKAAQNLI